MYEEGKGGGAQRIDLLAVFFPLYVSSLPITTNAS